MTESRYEVLSLKDIERRQIALALRHHKGNRTHTARDLGISRATLIKKIKTPIKVAVMGCEVNGPGEAKDADVGIAAGVGRAIIFRKGKKVRIVSEEDMLPALMEEIRKVEAELTV